MDWNNNQDDQNAEQSSSNGGVPERVLLFEDFKGKFLAPPDLVEGDEW